MVRKSIRFLRTHGIRAFIRRISVVRQLNASAESICPFPLQHFDVIFCIGCWEGESKRYRVYNLANALIDIGKTVWVMPYSDLASLKHWNIAANIVVLFRAPYEAFCDEYFDYARNKNITTCYDTDDLVFDEDIIGSIHAVKQMKASERATYLDGVLRYKKLMAMCDVVSVTTDHLAQQARKVNSNVFVIPNTLNSLQISLSEQLISHALEKSEDLNSDVIRIGYFSGSRTHDEDFLECSDVLFEILAKYPNVTFVIVGQLELDRKWNSFSKRVERHDFLPYLEMLKLLSTCHINIAPLNLRSLFNHSKSELKWFEAAVVEVPTIASPTDPYQKILSTGSLGFLALNRSDWNAALETLISDSNIRKKIGMAAREVALQKFDQDAMLLAFHNMTSSLNKDLISLDVKIKSKQAGKLRIDWIVPEIIIGGGGHRNIFRAAFYLEQFGHDVVLYIVGSKSGLENRQIIRDNFYQFNGKVLRVNERQRFSDVTLATHWSTVEIAQDGRGFTKQLIYFVQDFEPSFYPMGSDYILAENTYRQGLYCITSGQWCEQKLRAEFGLRADHFKFPIDKSVYYPELQRSRSKKVLFFAKPEMPRRCFELGAQMLRYLNRIRPDLELVLFGSSVLNEKMVDFPCTILSVVPTINELAGLYRESVIGVVFSTTNPSLVPYEMMACGLPVVDLARPGNEYNYDGRFDVAFLADPDPVKMATQINSLLSNENEINLRSMNGREFILTFPSEEEMAKRIEFLILNQTSAISLRDLQKESVL
ncbi:glycosyltransferase [Rhizobiales bacterium TNE-4]|nr:glycosyltransferase [Rhizobiales bacterium TNE-4]MBV1827560.1 glycosyltransferase [Rhizobiales bacterium TNE-4]